MNIAEMLLNAIPVMVREPGIGFCLACGSAILGVEPDDEELDCYKCERPGELYGISNLLLMLREAYQSTQWLGVGPPGKPRYYDLMVNEKPGRAGGR